MLHLIQQIQIHSLGLTKKEKAATIPRMQMEAEEDAQLFKPTGILKPPSISSVYDNVSGNVQLRKPTTGDDK
jgi:hypothetical protein